jgi:hypothetical protein
VSQSSISRQVSNKYSDNDVTMKSDGQKSADVNFSKIEEPSPVGRDQTKFKEVVDENKISKDKTSIRKSVLP